MTKQIDAHDIPSLEAQIAEEKSAREKVEESLQSAQNELKSAAQKGKLENAILKENLSKVNKQLAGKTSEVGSLKEENQKLIDEVNRLKKEFNALQVSNEKLQRKTVVQQMRQSKSDKKIEDGVRKTILREIGKSIHIPLDVKDEGSEEEEEEPEEGFV